MESGVDEAHLSKYLCSPNIDPLAIMVFLGNIETTYGSFNTTVTNIETVGDLVFASHLALEKKAAEHGLNLSDRITILFFPRGTLSKIEIRIFRGNTLGFNAYLVRKLGLLTANGTVPVDYYDYVVYRDNFVLILQESVVRLNPGSRGHSSDIVEPQPVGDTQANLLKIVPVKDKEGRIASEESTLDCRDRIYIP